ncbi:hypothetical protein LZ30DRAFT_696578 [Colletotrichum cereale]|nr:hypothetical protein LZ30DRAFT_696578 [Colletotrichum cereale]
MVMILMMMTMMTMLLLLLLLQIMRRLLQWAPRRDAPRLQRCLLHFATNASPPTDIFRRQNKSGFVPIGDEALVAHPNPVKFNVNRTIRPG